MPETPAAGTDTLIDTLVHPRWIIPVEPFDQVLEGHSLAIADGRIHAILPSAEARALPARQHIELPRHALLPGLVNAHGHAAMSLLRGYADDHPLHTWLNDHIWPAEGRWVNDRFVHDGAQLAVAEMLRSGTTTFSDMYFFPEETARVAATTGLRAQIAFPVFDFPSNWGSGPDEYIAKGLTLRDDYKHNPLVQVVFGPHAPYTVSDGPLQRIATLAAELDAGIHIHVHETQREVSDALAASGERPLARLHQLGLLSPRTQCVHAVALDASDIELLAENNCHVVHCPESNLKLASGFCPVQTLLDSGVNVAIGTDGAASNNDLDLFGELHTAALLAKAVAGDASALPAHAALRMATLSGARALGLDEEIGSLLPGKAADLIAVDLGELENQPSFEPVSQLVYTHVGSRVSHAWVAGRLLLEQRRLTTIDTESLRARVAHWQQLMTKG